MIKKVLLTGASGFVGKQILRELCEKGLHVRIIVRDSSNNVFGSDHRIEFITTKDLFEENAFWLREACKDIDTVIHAAWYAEPGEYLQSIKNIKCLEGTLKLAKAAAEAGVKRFVGLGTCFEYDLNFSVLSVNTPLKPISLYAGAKAAVYISLNQLLPNLGVDFAWCRLFYLYGEGEDERRLVPYIRNKLEKGQFAELTSGDQIRDFIDVREAGKKIVDIATGTKKGAVNICSGIPVSVRQMAENIAKEYGRLDLLKFNMRKDNFTDPAYLVGVKGEEEFQ
jgi:nucleoside-diphosphate-sugar epimerase